VHEPKKFSEFCGNSREVSPDLPTMVDAGFPILTLPDVRKRFDELGMVPMGTSPAQFAAAIASETPLSAAPRGRVAHAWRGFSCTHSHSKRLSMYAGSGSRLP
jgi:hypothetical protein